MHLPYEDPDSLTFSEVSPNHPDYEAEHFPRLRGSGTVHR